MIIQSLLDSDLYKLTMGQVVFFEFPTAWVRYAFTNRGKTQFPFGFSDALKAQLLELFYVGLKSDEKAWMESKSYFRPEFIEWFAGYRFNYNEVKISQTGGDLSIVIEGYWYRTIHWEVVLMALVSELYFKMTGQKMDEDAFSRIDNKAEKLENANALWSDFGTRRRFSFDVQNEVVDRMRDYRGFLGTSNPYLAMKYGVNAIGTSAHEATMAMQGLAGSVRHCNRIWLEKWYHFYRGELGIALTDTVTTDAFLEDFDSLLARIYDGTRQDSGDPYVWADKIIAHYKMLGIDPRSKTAVFSDGLNTYSYIAISNKYRDKFAKVIGGIGTHFTNHVGVTPLNIVIKMTHVAANPNSKMWEVVKLSDVEGKYNGSPEAIAAAKYQLGIS